MGELQELFDKFEEGLRSGKISPEMVKLEVGDRIAQLIQDYPEVFPNIEEIDYPKERWPEDKLERERAIDFSKRTLGNGTEEIRFGREKIRQENLALYQALTTYFRRYPNEGKIPDWWKKSSNKSKKQVDEELKKYNIQQPQDAFNRGLSV